MEGQTKSRADEIICPKCNIEMTEVLSWVGHPGPEGRMIGHPGPPLHYECKRCGNKIEREKKIALKKVSESNRKGG